MENSAETSPLLNDYKQEYFFQRFSRTVFGGPVFKISSDESRISLPFYVHICQFTVFILPFALSAIFAGVIETQPDINYWMSISFGCLMTIIMAIIHICRYLLAKKLDPLDKLSGEEEDIEFEGCCNIKQVLRFVINEKKWTLNIAVHALFYGIVNGVIFLYLLPSTSSRLMIFQSKVASVLYYVISWVTSCIGLYGLIAKPPTEPCQFKTTDQYEILVLTRPFYMCIFGIIGILAMFYPSLTTIDIITRIIFPCLPLFWTVGMLPQIDCFFAWLGEQVLVHLFGGSPMANSLRLLFMLTLSCFCWLIVYPISNEAVVLALEACFGLILSTDVSTCFEKITLNIFMKSKVQNATRGRPTNTATYSSTKIMYMLLVIIAAALIASLTNLYVLDDKKASLLDIIGYIIISFFVIQRVFGNVLSVYVFFGLITNPLYAVLKNGNGKRAVVLSRKVLINCVVPLLLVAFITLSAGSMNRSSTLSTLSFALFALRAYRFAWQNQQECALDVSILMLIKYSSVSTSLWWNNLPLHIRLFIVSLLRNRAQYLWNLVSFAVRFSYKFYFNRKVRHQSYKKVALFSLLAFPILIVFFGMSVVLSAPILPIFTLPVFLMGFPRPRIFWPHADTKVHSSSKEWIYYKQLTPSLLNCLKDIISSGSLGEVSAGEHFLARFQDRLVWLVVAEKGFMHTNVIVKGLELAETSCHTVEAGRIDDMFEYILGDVSRPFFNPYPGHGLLPCDVIELDTYSDARNVLTGIIDSPDNIKQLSTNFMKTLTWVLLKFSKSRRDRGQGDGPTAEELKTRSAAKERKYSLDVSQTNLTKDTFIVQANSIEDILGERSSSLHSKSSLSDNSMTALWSNREGLKMLSIKGKADDPKHTLKDEIGVPAVNIAPFGKSGENAARQTEFRGPNLVMGDDFDDFGFDDADDGLFRKDSFSSVDDNEHKSKSIMDNILDTNSLNFTDQATHNRLPKRNTLPSLDIDVSSPHSSLVEPPLRWKLSIPVDAVDISKYQNDFSEDWFKFVITQVGLEEKGDRVLKSLSADRGLLYIFRKLVSACYFVIYEQQQHTALDIWRSFTGIFPWSRYSTWFEHDTELYRNVLLAYRYAFKLMYDEAVLGPIDDFEELAEYLLDYEDNWHMGNDSEDVWVNAVLSGTPNLLSLGYNKEDGTFTSRVLTKQKMAVPVGRLDAENVKAIWASLSLELLYFTNDDEERYSIQAHPSHLRNIIVQAADPPLGYPVYSSGLLNVVAW